ncbi:MAG: LamG-like jellyroll fold domain-containing protein [bacterium]|nr:LamG-like jellyroll fold domain-containing protein [bacterium]
MPIAATVKIKSLKRTTKPAVKRLPAADFSFTVKIVDQRLANRFKAPASAPFKLNFAIIARPIIKTTALLLIIMLNWFGLSAVGRTFAYFNDTETAGQNVYTAGFLNMVITPTGDFSPRLTPTQNSSREITVAKPGGLDFQYKAKISNLSGNSSFCNNLNLKATLNSGTLYDGSLAGFNIATTTDLGAINFTASSNAHGFNQTCNFNMVFTAWQVNLDNENLGFSDEETISNSLVGGQDDVVLNEFLPHPIGGDGAMMPNGEWVELYNNTNSPIDLNGYYLTDLDSNHRIDIESCRTNTGNTTILGKSFLVVYRRGSGSCDNSHNFNLNNDIDTVNFYDNYGGLVDTYSYSGSDYNINDTPGATNNLVAYLPFNNDLLDKSGNNNNGTNNGTTFTSVSEGKAEQALNLTGTQYVEVPDSASLDITNQITLEAWVYPTAWDNNYENNILTKGGDSDWGVWNLHHTSTGGFRFELNGHGLFETIPSTALNTWYHIVGVYNGSEMKLYVNGVLSGSLTTSGSIATNNSPLRIGKQFWSGANYSYWNGRIDEVKIYNRALSATEVSEYFNTVNDGETSIPVGKSFARIPDGVGEWVDPIPTPGRTNNFSEIPEIILPEIQPTATSTILLILENPAINVDAPENIATTTESIATTTENIIENLSATTTPEITPENIADVTEPPAEDPAAETPADEIIVADSVDNQEILNTDESTIAPAAEPIIESEPPLNSPTENLTGQATANPEPVVEAPPAPAPEPTPAPEAPAVEAPPTN